MRGLEAIMPIDPILWAVIGRVIREESPYVPLNPDIPYMVGIFLWIM